MNRGEMKTCRGLTLITLWIVTKSEITPLAHHSQHLPLWNDICINANTLPVDLFCHVHLSTPPPPKKTKQKKTTTLNCSVKYINRRKTVAHYKQQTELNGSWKCCKLKYTLELTLIVFLKMQTETTILEQ